MIGIAPGLVSNIDETGDFIVVSKDGSENAIAESLIRLVKDDPAITIIELAKATKLSSWVVRKTLTFRGWIKDAGGTKGASRWRFDLDAAAKKAVSKRLASVLDSTAETKDEDEVEDIVM